MLDGTFLSNRVCAQKKKKKMIKKDLLIDPNCILSSGLCVLFHIAIRIFC